MTDWTQQPWIPKKDLVAWHFYKEGDSADGDAKDYSGNVRHIAAASNKPVLTPNVFKGNYGWYFNGSRNPMLYSGSVTMKHVFVLLSFEEEQLAEYRGVLTGLSANWILTGEDGSNEFYLHGGTTPERFYKSGVLFPSNDMQAPMDGKFAVVEAIVPTLTTSFNGIQVGKNGDDAGNYHLGHWIDQAIYSVEQTGENRRQIYEYYATRYFAWQQNSAGLDVWPFQPEAEHGLISDKVVLSSTTVSGKRKSRSKSSAKDAFQLVFEERTSEEHDAARRFWNEHYPGTSFIYIETMPIRRPEIAQ